MHGEPQDDADAKVLNLTPCRHCGHTREKHSVAMIDINSLAMPLARMCVCGHTKGEHGALAPFGSACSAIGHNPSTHEDHKCSCRAFTAKEILKEFPKCDGDGAVKCLCSRFIEPERTMSIQPIDVWCSYCGRWPGDPCNSIEGRAPHGERVMAAAKHHVGPDRPQVVPYGPTLQGGLVVCDAEGGRTGKQIAAGVAADDVAVPRATTEEITAVIARPRLETVDLEPLGKSTLERIAKGLAAERDIARENRDRAEKERDTAKADVGEWQSAAFELYVMLERVVGLDTGREMRTGREQAVLVEARDLLRRWEKR